MARPGGSFWRALTAFLVLPGVVAFALPWLLRPRDGHASAVGFLPLGGGVLLLLWCVRDFYVAGRGTLAPWAPPEHLVTVGLYRVSRNPMYLAVLMILAGWAVSWRSGALWAYAALVAVLFHLRIVLGEEPWLARRHGHDWTVYRRHVPRWLIPLARRHANFEETSAAHAGAGRSPPPPE